MRFAEAVLRQARVPARPHAPRILSYFEFWPSWLFYAPVAAYWVLLGLRYGNLCLPTAANPAITVGGLCGESKRAILDQVPSSERDVLARYTSVLTDNTDATADVLAAEQALAAAGLDYPLVAKPDIGCNGSGVRLLASRSDLSRYLREFPRNCTVLLQELIPDEGEAGLFYIRHPGAQHGYLSSVTLKQPPFVVGDGHSTLRQLILADPRAGRVSQLYLPRLAQRLHEIPRQGEHVRLVFVGNHCKGSLFRNGIDVATEALSGRVDELARALPEFYFGRIDVRFTSLSALARGEGFRVIEINGVGSEPTHIWDPATRLREAWHAQFFHYGAAFRIGAANRCQGAKPASVMTVWRNWRLQNRLMRHYPMND